MSNAPAPRVATSWWVRVLVWVARAMAAYLAFVALAALLAGSDDGRLAGVVLLGAAAVVLAASWWLSRRARAVSTARSDGA